MRMRKTALLTMVLLVVSILLMGCGARSSWRVGWRASDGLKRKTARYVSFSGVERKPFRLEAGGALTLDYEIEVEEGALTLKLLDPDGDAVWDETFAEAEGAGGQPRISYSGEYELAPVPQSGRYKLQIEGDATKGSYDVSWQVAGS